MPLEVVVLAASHGNRMHSRTPKVFHKVLGKPMLAHVLETVHSIGAERVHVVLLPNMQDRAAKLLGDDVSWVHQTEPRGTGHAVQQALPHIATDSRVLVISGNTPLYTEKTLARTLAEDPQNLVMVTTELENPSGYDSICRDEQNRVCGVSKDCDTNLGQKCISEVNGGVIAAPVQLLKDLLGKLESRNAHDELHLTDIVALAAEEGVSVNTVPASHSNEVVAINDRVQLARSERIMALQRADELMASGVTLRDPKRFDLRGSLHAGMDCCIDINVIVEGDVELGDDVEIGPGCVLRDVRIGDGVRVHEHCVVESATIGDRCTIGPLARIRPDSTLEDDVRIGNFVEVKASRIGRGTKAGHLAYIGDADVGQDVNVGAGAITCNFDGASKHRTIIGDNVFIGTNCTMVAPLKIESGAFIAAGSTITSDVTGNVLAVGRARQRIISRWISPRKRKKA
ncbi:MAG: bifunctional UDP-N-acetylglucosamine diphosphorylase/glucosamine-1-phosphate N-acetyltransferase GlmU [Gammaproteobacteria bacterium]|nr:bifunctional UDP-N-acetylglucosamine diphosphorylase/glucosamine-1-phosphate N-acetyltransferase GlmU [Gammaproteobacteria bacterium]